MFLFKELEEGFAPERQTMLSAGWDVKTTKDMNLKAGHTHVIPLGVKIETWLGHLVINGGAVLERLELHPRSSLRVKGVISGVGVIDADYRDEIKMIVHPTQDLEIKRGERVGQLIPVNVYPETMRGVRCKASERKGGLGSTNN